MRLPQPVRLTLFVCLLAGIFTIEPAAAVDYIWTGSDSTDPTDWGTFNNWNPNANFPGNGNPSDTALLSSAKDLDKARGFREAQFIRDK